MTEDQSVLARWLAAQGARVDEETLAALVEWHRAWRREWHRVRSLPLADEDLPAPLWCWPP